MAKTAPKRAQDLLTKAEVLSLADACSHRSPTGIRNRALILVLASTGLRISEALALSPRDFDADEGTLRIHRGKGGRSRVVAIGSSKAQDALLRWMDRREALGVNGHHRIFCTLKGGEMNRRYVAALLPRIASQAGIDKRVHAHGLRHYFAAALAQQACPVTHIQGALGHSSLHTTTIYLSRISPTETHAAVRKAFEGVLD